MSNLTELAQGIGKDRNEDYSHRIESVRNLLSAIKDEIEEINKHNCCASGCGCDATFKGHVGDCIWIEPDADYISQASAKVVQEVIDNLK